MDKKKTNAKRKQRFSGANHVVEDSSGSRSSIPAHFDADRPFVNSESPNTVFDLPEIKQKQEIQFPLELGDIFSRSFFHRNKSFIVSFSLHLIVLLGLSYSLMHIGERAIVALDALMLPPKEPDPQSVQVDFEIPVPVAEEPPTEDESNESSTEQENPTEFVAANNEQGSESGSSADGSGSGSSYKLGDGKSAEFFGTRVEGNSFVYILDKSGSMANSIGGSQTNRFDAATAELRNSIYRLTDKQYFYVMLFSSSTQRLFNDRSPEPQMVRATAENKALFDEWLRKEHVGGGTDPRDSLKTALKLKPNSIFMLSDGQFNAVDGGSPTAADIAKAQPEASRIPINSIAFEDQSATRQLSELAELTGGNFAFVDIVAEQKAMTRFLEKTRNQNLTFDERIEIALNEAIPLFGKRDSFRKGCAIEALNNLSLDCYSDIRSINDSARKAEHLAEGWRRIWSESTELREFLTKLEKDGAIKDDDFAKFSHQTWNFVSATMHRSRNKVVQDLSMMQLLLKYQPESGPSSQIRLYLLRLMDRLSPKTVSKRTFLLDEADSEDWNKRYRSLIREREITAKRLYKTYSGVSSNAKAVEWRNKILTQYPETEYAETLRAKENQK